MQTRLKQRPIHLLVADDDKDDRFFFEEAVGKINIPIKLRTVNDGENLMKYLTGNLDELPDILFLDLNMPRKNGSECLTEIKQNSKLQHIPVAIYSTALRKEVADLLYLRGAHYYLHKSSFDNLAKGIQEILSRLSKQPSQPSRNEFIIDLQEA